MIIVSAGSTALSTVRLNATQWGISLLLGAISLPVAVLIRLIPDEFIRRCILRIYDRNQLLNDQISNEVRFEWNDSLEDIREELIFCKMNRGGRIYALFRRSQWLPNLALNHTLIPRMRRRRENGHAGLSRYGWKRSRSKSVLAPAAAMAGVVAGSIAGWSPIERVAEEGR